MAAQLSCHFYWTCLEVTYNQKPILIIWRKKMERLFDLLKKYKRLVATIVTMLLLLTLGFSAFQKYKESKIEVISYLEFCEFVDDGQVELLEYTPNKDIMIAYLTDGSVYKTLYPEYEEFRKDMLDKGVNIKKKSGFSKDTLFIVIELGIVLLYVRTFVFMTKTMGNVKENDILQRSDVKFDQVIGLDEIMDDISLYVSMIKNPNIGKEIGAKMPKGVLLSGDPGTGKTLIAKAIAGEADVPFISVSGSEFAEMYKGVGARRVRKVFKIARKNAPCVVFIDEIDAIGGKRDDYSDSEDTQTINQLLKEMDGFEDLDGVFVLAATNCPDNLDDAIKRSGRFDRQVNILPPRDWRVRKQLLDLYLKDYKVSTELSTEVIAKAIAGFTGADIAMICNEAGIVAIGKGLSEIDRACIDEAIDKKIFNGNRAKREQFAKDREIVTYHEAGHAVMKYLLGQPISRVSIVGTTSGVGGAVFGEDKDGLLRTNKDIKENILVCYAGRVAEKIKFDDISTGSVDDISKATDYILSSVSNYGFDEEIGAVDLKLLHSKDISADNLGLRITETAKNFEKQAEAILLKNYEMVEKLANTLFEKEIMTGNEVYKLLSE